MKTRLPNPNTRQAAVYRLAKDGADVRQIGAALDMRLLTVRQHLCMLRKMGALDGGQVVPFNRGAGR